MVRAEHRKLNKEKMDYPGYDVKVFMKDGKVASGNMKLANVRSGK